MYVYVYIIHIYIYIYIYIYNICIYTISFYLIKVAIQSRERKQVSLFLIFFEMFSDSFVIK